MSELIFGVITVAIMLKVVIYLANKEEKKNERITRG